MRVNLKMKNILIINGPNLNLLGQREPEIYGNSSLKDIEKSLNISFASESKFEWFQSNIEGEIIDRLQKTLTEKIDGIIINPGGYSHTSVAIYDALKLLKTEIIEVHLSQVYQREDFRQILLTGRAASKIMSGFGDKTYYYAALSIIDKKDLK